MTRPNLARVGLATLLGGVVVLPAAGTATLLLDDAPPSVYLVTPSVEAPPEAETGSS